MAEENQNNSQQNSSQPAGSALPVPVDSAKTAVNPVNSAITPVKKPKTEKQIARERERRRRRRQKKTAPVIAPASQKPLLTSGQDVPLLDIREDKSGEDIIAPADANLVENPEVLADFDEPRDVMFPHAQPEQIEDVDIVEAPPTPPEAVLPPQPEEVAPEEPEQIIVEPEAEVIDPVVPSEEIIAPPESEPVEAPEIQDEPAVLEDSQKIFEESPSYEETEENQESSDENTESEVVDDLPPEHEEHLEKSNADKAKELHESLLNEPDSLDELPVKQGIMGMFFDKLAELVQGSRNKKTAKAAAPETEQEAEVEETVITEVDGDALPEERSSGIPAIIGNILKFAVVIVLIIAAFWIGSSLKVVDRINGLFKPDPAKEQLVTGDNLNVTIDDQLLRQWGFITAKRFGQNLGNSSDLTYNIFYNANYFGKLMDPVFYGETGISAAIYYGFGREVEFARNRFIYYVEYISNIVNANSVKIEDVMKRNSRRDIALNAYIAESQKIFETGNTLRKEINVQIDDLKISINTLGPDKARYETDFFASMDDFEGQKATDLLNEFIQSTQTESALKAKLAALSRLSQAYETQLVKLKLRIDAVNTNKDALVSGVVVTETPGGGLNLIRQ